MSDKNLAKFYNQVSDPQEEIKAIRDGIEIKVAENFLEVNKFSIKLILESLAIPTSTFFSTKKKKARLNQAMSEKFLRLMQILRLAQKIIGVDEGRSWLERKIPSLGNQKPVDLLDTEPGHKLVEQALLQIEYGIYG